MKDLKPKKQQQKEEQPRFLDVPLELIDTEGQSVRDMQDDDHVVELAMSISTHGLLQPIVLSPKKDGRFQLDAGFHRLAAFHRLRKLIIPAQIKYEDTGPVKAIALVENIVRKNMTLDEEVKAVFYLYNDEELSISSICDLTGKSTQWVQRRIMIPNLPQDVLEDLIEGRISIGHAEILSQLKDDSTRRLVLNQVITGKLSTRQTDELANLYLQAPEINEAIEAGLQTARQIQQETKIYRKCEGCSEIHRIEEVRFICVCAHCFNIFESMKLEAIEKRRKKNGD